MAAVASAGVGQSQELSPGFLPVCMSPSTWTIFCPASQEISRELDQKWSGWDSNQLCHNAGPLQFVSEVSWKSLVPPPWWILQEALAVPGPGRKVTVVLWELELHIFSGPPSPEIPTGLFPGLSEVHGLWSAFLYSRVKHVLLLRVMTLADQEPPHTA